MQTNYADSNYRFTEPIRYFKANDPYYFEVDNIPLKQLQENCLWLKDQLNKINPSSEIKRGDIDELRPYANGADRIIRVKPGRYTARINDASNNTPLAYLRKVMGEALGDVDGWSTALANPGSFIAPNDLNAGDSNTKLVAALNTFKTLVAQNALGMNGLAERAFTWATVNSDRPIDNKGAGVFNNTFGIYYAGADVNNPGGDASVVPFVITQALLWAKSNNAQYDSMILTSYDYTDSAQGFSKLPKTENYFIKAWRGVARLAIVDVEDEITVEVPQFDPSDFSYVDENGVDQPVPGVAQRIDLVFIYSKPVDTSSVTILNKNGKQTLTKPALGIVRGAGIKTNLQGSLNYTSMGLVAAEDSILASPSDQVNSNMGFTSTSANDLSYDIRGSFPAPDDLLNLAPLISERLEDTAYELVGQSILPIAYIFVDGGSTVVLETDVIDIRPFFRTAELAYNERAGIAAAFPQLSLANPAVGKAQLDF
jgi:hypothetical protein